MSDTSQGRHFPTALSWLAAALALAASPLAQAGHIHPNLEQRLANAGDDELVPVIVELEERANPHTAAAAHPRSDRQARGRAVVQALRETADRTQGPVRERLEQERARGKARDVKHFWIMNGASARATKDVIRDLARRPDVRVVRLDVTIPRPVPRPTSEGTLSEAEPAWGVWQIRAPDVWALGAGYTGAGIVVGSFDTGVDGTHPDLAPRYRGNHAISWFDPYGEHSAPYDANGHGTHTTGTIVGGDLSGYQIGVAPGAKWIAAKGWSDFGAAFESTFHQIFEWFLAPGGNPANAPHVVNSSWGMSPPDCFLDFEGDIQAWRAAGIVPIFASGNEGPAPQTVLSPGAYSNTYTVGATDFFDEIAEFSSRGPSPCTGAVKPNLSAPGVAILSTFPGGDYFEADGTSMATPHVSGAAAVLLSIDPTLTVDEVEAALTIGAVDLGPVGPDNDFGVGRLDLFESARILLGLTSVGITPTTPEAFEAGTVPGVFTITRKGSTTDPITVTYTVSGTAVSGSDYVALPGIATIPAGATTVTIPVTPIDDAVVERNESVIVTLNTDPAFIVSPAQAIVMVVSDEIPPDLVVTSLTAPSAVGAGDTLTITDTTRNTGAAPAGPSTTAFFLSANSAFDAGDLPLATRTVAALAAGASDTGSVTVTIPASTAAGSYWIIAVADPADELVETLEFNNTLSRSLNVGPDFVVSGLSGPADSGAGQPISLTVTTRNQGAGAAPASTTTFYLSTDAVLDASDAALGSRAVPALAPGASDLATTVGTVPAGTAAGTYYLFARADSNDAVGEVFETNNTIYGGSIRIGPDLMVATLTSPAAAAPGATINVADTTRNFGGGAAAASTTRFYLSTNTVLDAGDTVLGSRAVAALAPGASDSGSMNVTIPVGTTAGSYWLLAKADADDGVTESQEGNNLTIRSLTIGADLVVSALSGPMDTGAGLVVAISVTTRNQGASPAVASTTALFLSADATLDAADLPFGTRAVPALAAGAQDTGSVTATIPAGTASGTYYVFARADNDNLVAETLESNNTSTWVMRIGPDLTVSSLTAPASAGAGTTISLTDTTRNAGGGAAATSTTRYYLSTNTSLDAGDVPLGGRSIPVLAAGVSNVGTQNVTIPAGTVSGQYYLIVVADGDGVVAESLENNNVLVRAITVGADLVVTTFTGPSDAAAGQTITLTDTTRNQGASAAGASTTAYYLSTNTILDAADPQLGSRAVTALGPGASETGTASVTIPAGTAAGTYTLIARADALETVVETAETNNVAFWTLRVGPDLVIASLTAPASSAPGTTIPVSDTTRNAGAGAAGATNTRFYLSTNAVLDAGDLPLGSRAVAALAGGAVDSGTVNVTIPAGTAPGNYYIIAAADGDNAVGESQEGNNTLARSFAIGADLVVQGLSGPTDSGAGLTVTLNVTTRNQGASPAGASTTSFYLSTDAMLDAADALLGTRSVPALDPGMQDTGGTPVTIPAGTAAGTYYLFARADSGSVVLETSEANNTTYGGSIRIGPDLLVTVLTAPASAPAGSTISVGDTTRNTGGGSAGATTTRFYLSTNPVLDAADVPLGSRAIAALAAGASDVGTLSVVIPAGTTPGTYYLIAAADADGAVPEHTESNNRTYRSMQVQ